MEALASIASFTISILGGTTIVSLNGTIGVDTLISILAKLQHYRNIKIVMRFKCNNLSRK